MTASSSTESEIIQVPAGTLLVTENDRSRKMFILKKGRVRVFKNYLSQRITLAILSEGEIFGELSFFDAEPRAASVEALTECTLQVIDGEKAASQISSLPDWVLPIFKTVFHRFREADQKLIVLQSMSEYQKKSFKMDTVGKTVYLELQRFIKTLEILHARATQGGQKARSESILKELDEVLGKRYIGLKVFWQILKENDLIDNTADEKSGETRLNEAGFEKWKKYLNSEIASENYLILSHASIALLRRMMGFLKTEKFKDHTHDEPVTITFDDIRLTSLPLHEDAIKELTQKKILAPAGETFVVKPSALSTLYLNQSILKNFDHTIMMLDG